MWRDAYDVESIEIGDHVWIGANSVILPGTSIGPGCVVGAGSIVRGKFEPNSLIAGVPARFVRALSRDVPA
ncbi:acyltransferase [Nocardioides sp. CCNWLW216]